MFKVLNEIRKNCWEYRKIIRIICGILVFAGISVKTAYSEKRTEDIANNLVETREVLPENEGKLIFISGTPTIENDGVIIFCLSTRPITREYFVVGNAKSLKKGYHIMENCIGCGTCQAVCLQDAIRPGTPFVIDESHCLQCGNCAENCPVEAIERY